MYHKSKEKCLTNILEILQNMHTKPINQTENKKKKKKDEPVRLKEISTRI